MIRDNHLQEEVIEKKKRKNNNQTQVDRQKLSTGVFLKCSYDRALSLNTDHFPIKCAKYIIILNDEFFDYLMFIKFIYFINHCYNYDVYFCERFV